MTTINYNDFDQTIACALSALDALQTMPQACEDRTSDLETLVTLARSLLNSATAGRNITGMESLWEDGVERTIEGYHSGKLDEKEARHKLRRLGFDDADAHEQLTESKI